MKLVLIGPPLSGKGSLAKHISRTQGLVHISTGDLFREAIANGSPLGLEAKSYMDRGDLVPDDLTVKILMARLSDPDVAKGFVLDGFPRTLGQAQALAEVLELDKAIYFEVSKEFLLNRLEGRVVCPGCGSPFHLVTSRPKVEMTCDHCQTRLVKRSDDNLESFANRYDLFISQTRPLVEFYQKAEILQVVDARLGVQELAREILS